MESTTTTPQPGPRSLREDLVPFFHNELRRCFGPNGTGTPAGSVPDLPKHLLIDAWHLGASDIHYEPQSTGAHVRVRIDGTIWDVAHLTHDQGKVFLNQFKAMAGVDPVVRFTPADANATFHMVDEKLDLRLSLAPSSSGETLAVRLLDPDRLDRSILELGLSEENLDHLKDWLNQTNGMFLAAGPTGSGKTTTAYSLLHELKSGSRVIITLEDPVEYQVDGVIQIQINELQDMTFAEGAKAMLRHDPDALMLGEIRDAVSAHVAVQAAIAGRVLLSTIHSRDAVGAVTALRNWGLTDREIADALTVVVAQRLVRKLCNACRKLGKPSRSDAVWLASFELAAPAKIWQPVGCKECKGLGYRGRTGIFEVWHLDEVDFQMILTGKDELELRRSLVEREHTFLIHDALAKLKKGVTSLEEVKRIAGGIRRLPRSVT